MRTLFVFEIPATASATAEIDILDDLPARLERCGLDAEVYCLPRGVTMQVIDATEGDPSRGAAQAYGNPGAAERSCA